ncbi:MAG: hypothetical protein HYV09_07615 [Deltaproteobacteria bacterium]|nr:hypothetical protein [Deltaproteobacteria bacterium]
MSHVSTWVVIFVWLGALTACESAGGLPANPGAIPKGLDWVCFADDGGAFSDCSRTAEECEQDRKVANEAGLTPGPCTPSDVAFCHTYKDVKTGQPGAFCALEKRICEKAAETGRRKGSRVEVSDCVSQG